MEISEKSVTSAARNGTHVGGLSALTVKRPIISHPFIARGAIYV
jgi:hypothetical protein